MPKYTVSGHTVQQYSIEVEAETPHLAIREAAAKQIEHWSIGSDPQFVIRDCTDDVDYGVDESTAIIDGYYKLQPDGMLVAHDHDGKVAKQLGYVAWKPGVPRINDIVPLRTTKT
jgi:hypothetical protein